MNKLSLIAIFAIIATLGIGYASSESYIIISQSEGQNTHPISIKDSSETDQMWVTSDGMIGADGIKFTGDGFPTGAIPDFYIYKNTTHVIAINTTTNKILSQSTDASTVIQATFTEVNKNDGGWVHVKGYSTGDVYEITTCINIPQSGFLKFTGDGRALTVFDIPVGSDNDMFCFLGTPPTEDSFFNYFGHFRMLGNPVSAGGSTNSGFNLNSTTYGVVDSIWDNLYITHFAGNAFYSNNVNGWNNVFKDSVLEYGDDELFVKSSSSDMKILNNKFLYNLSPNAIRIDGDWTVFSGNFVYGNDQNAIQFKSTARQNVIDGNIFYRNGDTADDTYYDINAESAQGNIISNNIFGGNNGANRVKHAILFGSGSSNNTVTGNNFNSYGATTQHDFGSHPIQDNGDNHITSSNTGLGWNYQGASNHTSLGIGQSIVLHKTADTTIQSDVVSNCDPDLTFTAPSNKRYLIEVMAFINSDSSADFKYNFDAPPSATGKYIGGDLNSIVEALVPSTIETSQLVTTDSTNEVIVIPAYVNISTAGTFCFEWSQNTSQALDTTLQEGSTMTVTRIR